MVSICTKFEGRRWKNDSKFEGRRWINRGVIFSPMAFKLGANRDHIGMFNISTGFFEIQKFEKMTVFAI